MPNQEHKDFRVSDWDYITSRITGAKNPERRRRRGRVFDRKHFGVQSEGEGKRGKV